MFGWLKGSKNNQPKNYDHAALSQDITLLLCYDFDETITWLHMHSMDVDEISSSHLKHPDRLKTQIEKAFRDGHKVAITSNNESITLIRQSLIVIGLSENIVDQIVIVGRNLDGGKKHHVNFVLREYSEDFRNNAKVILIDDSPANVRSIYSIGGAGVVVLTPDVEHGVQVDTTAHLNAVDAILANPKNYRQICDEHNRKFTDHSFEPEPATSAGIATSVAPNSKGK